MRRGQHIQLQSGYNYCHDLLMHRGIFLLPIVKALKEQPLQYDTCRLNLKIKVESIGSTQIYAASVAEYLYHLKYLVVHRSNVFNRSSCNYLQ